MNIIYGIQATNNGHITRSLSIINKLRDLGHQVDILTSGNNSQLNIPNVKYNFKGLTFYYTKNGNIDFSKTYKQLSFIQLYKDIKNLDLSCYDLIISDFEPITAWCGKLAKRNVIGISNQYSTESIIGYPLSKLIIKYLAPVTIKIGLAYNGEFTPVIQKNICNKSDSDYIVVYLSQYKLIDIEYKLIHTNQKYKIYTKEAKFHYKIQNLEIYPIDHTFVESLNNCKAVITASGFQTTAEALYLNKLLLTIPIKNQYEQLLNAKLLSKMGVYTVKHLEDINIEHWLNKFKKLNITYDSSTTIDKICDYIINSTLV